MVHRGYSSLLKPILITLDLAVINIVMYLINSSLYLDFIYILFFNTAWLLISYNNKYYNIYRTVTPSKVIYLTISQFTTFFLAYFTYFGIFMEGYTISSQLETLVWIYGLIVLVKLSVSLTLKLYRIAGRNYRNVIIIGEGESIDILKTYFKEKVELGYRLKGYFSDVNDIEEAYLGPINKAQDFALNNEIDAVYLSLNALSKSQISDFEQFADKNLITLKLVPDAKGVFRKMMDVQYYDYLPVILFRKLPLDDSLKRAAKRFFDILFSLLVITLLLSWLLPLVAILIRLESKGPILFKQQRHGLNGRPFHCYKLRSMHVNDQSHKLQATKLDARVTKIGAFIRKTSIDELPQFFNVLLGSMSVVGPRPHMLQHTEEYSKSVNKYMVRHFVKPGITGLAQIKGYRGEIKVLADINNRVRYDIFYLENYSLLLDIRIILITTYKALRGDEKAY